MTPEHLREYLVRFNLSKQALADQLGLSRQHIYKYLSGLSPIPRTVDLACCELAKRDPEIEYEEDGIGEPIPVRWRYNDDGSITEWYKWTDAMIDEIAAAHDRGISAGNLTVARAPASHKE